MAQHQESTIRSEQDETQKGTHAQREIWHFTVELLTNEARSTFGPESPASASLTACLRDLSAKISEAKSNEDCNTACLDFLNKIEQELGRNDGIYRVIYKTRWLIEQAEKTTTSRQKTETPQTKDQAHIALLDKKPEESASRLRKFWESMPIPLRRIAENEAFAAIPTSIMYNYAVMANMLTPDVRGQLANVAKGSAALVMTYYIFNIVLLSNAATKKAGDGKNALNLLMISIEDYARFAPESYTILLKIVESLEDGLTNSGNFGKTIALVSELRLVSRDRPESSVTARTTGILAQLSIIQNACNPVLTKANLSTLRRLRIVATLLTTLSSSQPIEAACYGQTVAAITSALQSDVEKKDEPWKGNPDESPLSVKPLLKTREKIRDIRKSAKIVDNLRKESTKENITDDEIARSFYEDFKAIFNPWYEKVQRADSLGTDFIRRELNSTPELGNDAKELRRLEKEALALKEKYIGLSPKPEFLHGTKLVEVGANDKSKQISFRYSDDPLKQLALLERVKHLIKTDGAFDEPKKGAAYAFIKKWIEKMGLERSQQKDPAEKSIEQEIDHAIKSMVTELQSNISDPKKRPHVHYVRERQQGATHLETETANRKSDWEKDNIEIRLTPIQRGVIEKLASLETDEQDPDTKTAYSRVIEDINKTRQEEGLPPIEI